MPRKSTNERIQCRHFAWRLTTRSGIYYADGRSNKVNAGRHSLGVADRATALEQLAELDQVRAEQLGLAPKSQPSYDKPTLLTISETRRLYEEYASRPQSVGGVKPATLKKYQAFFDKFVAFAETKRLDNWNGVDDDFATQYAGHLERRHYARKSICNEIVVLKQVHKWLIGKGHLNGQKPLSVSVKEADTEPAYCYTTEQVAAIYEHCQQRPDLEWLGNVIGILAHTGLRIGELAALRWGDIDLDKQRITLTDESGHAQQKGNERRQLKSGRSRSLPIRSDLLPILQGMNRCDKQVVTGPRGTGLKPDTARHVLVRDVIEPLADQFPHNEGVRGFRDGRLHTFRHYFCSTCANSGVPERMLMDWLGHADSDMIRHYYHLADNVAKCQMDSLCFLDGGDRRSVTGEEANRQEKSEPKQTEGNAIAG